MKWPYHLRQSLQWVRPQDAQRLAWVLGTTRRQASQATSAGSSACGRACTAAP